MPDLLTWASGYKPAELDELEANRSDRRKLQFIGGSILLTMVWFGLMGSVAAWGLTGGLAYNDRLTVAAIASTFASAFVLTFDRMTIYFIDTTNISRARALSFTTVRVALVISIGALIDTQIMPYAMKGELAHHASQMRENAERGRVRELTARYQIPNQIEDIKESKSLVEVTRSALVNVPERIQAERARASACFASLTKMMRTSPAYSARRATCVTRRVAAEAKRREYLSQTHAKLVQAEADERDARESLRSTKHAMTNRVERAAKEDENNLTAGSFAVFWDLVTNDVGARFKAIALLIVHLCFDLMPFVAKGMSGGTGVGARVRARLEADRANATADQISAEHDANVRATSRQMAAHAAVEALNRPTMRTFMADLAEAEARITEPVEMAVAAFERVVKAEARLKRVPTRTAALKTLNMELWARAIAESVEAATQTQAKTYRPT